MALKNLSENSGDQDVIRLTLRMEAKLSENRLALLEPRSVEDVVVRLELTESDMAHLMERRAEVCAALEGDFDGIALDLRPRTGLQAELKRMDMEKNTI